MRGLPSLGLLAVSFLGVARPALAWDDAPLCTFPSESSGIVRDDADNGMCSETSALPTLAENSSSQPVSASDARHALLEYREATQRGDFNRALLSLQVVEWYAPELSDRIALMRGETMLQLSNPRAALVAFEAAEESLHPAVAIRGRVGRVRALLAAADPRAESAFDELSRTFPDLPNRTELRYQVASTRVLLGQIDAGLPILREIDLIEPGSPWALRARQDMDRLRAAGVRIPGFSDEERVSRAERLVRSGPMDDARAEVSLLRARADLARAYMARVISLAARIARVEGRFDDATALAAEAASLTAATATAANAPADAAPQLTPTESRIRSMFEHNTLTRQPTAQLLRSLDIAVGAAMPDVTEAIIVSIAQRRDVNSRTRFDAAMTAAGVVSDATLIDILSSLIGDADVGPRSRYHRARAYERVGRQAEAKTEFESVIASDRSEMRWYTLLSRLRLRALESNAATASVDDESGMESQAKPDSSLFLNATASHVAETVADALIVDNTLDAEGAELALRQVLPRASGYPWIRRALALVRLREFDAAGDELHEAYLAYRQTHGRFLPRAGLEAVYRGAPPRPRSIDAATRRARAALMPSDLERLADAAAKIGDHGVAVAFGGRSRASSHPRAYAAAVMAAAARHHVDPDLLFAVMRVESVFDRRIVSYAGAIGLMQIMPRTANLIANRLGRAEFTVADLLDPRTNVEFAAWYLASLLQRFEGRLPLAIAAYNGGPHNVRQWLNDYASSMPLDAFLERIPFGQTYQYVRRVLGHYSAYRASRNLPMVMLDTTLPGQAVDRVAF